MAFNPNEAPEGYEAVESDGCNGECAFEYRSKECLSAACGNCHRKDGCSVIFVRRPEGKATASWPYDSEGTPVDVERNGYPIQPPKGGPCKERDDHEND